MLKTYGFHSELTARLDSINVDDLNKELLYEIVLWKLSRFPYVSSELLEKLKGVATLQPKDHTKAKDILGELLRSRGIALPMASTILRFLKPSVFQIIDDRAYRVLFPGKEKYPSKPAKISERYVENSTKIYFEYLDELHRVASEKLPFKDSDRILYQLDKLMGNKIGEKA